MTPSLLKDSMVQCSRSEGQMLGRDGMLIFTWTETPPPKHFKVWKHLNLHNLSSIIHRINIEPNSVWTKKQKRLQKCLSGKQWRRTGVIEGNTTVSQEGRTVVRMRGGKAWEWETAQKRLSIFRLQWVQSSGSVIISQFGVFGMDRYRAGRPSAQGHWFTMGPVYYSSCACM